MSFQTGESVTYFVNGIEASTEEVQKILPMEVRRIEILRRPMDPKFEGAKGVINFIVKRREDGGYVSAEANPSFIYDKANYSLFATYSKARWNYTALGGIYYENSDGDSIVSRRDFEFEGVGKLTETDRKIMTSRRQRQYYGALQASRTSANGNTLVIKAGNRTFHNPHLDYEGVTEYQDRSWRYENCVSQSSSAPYIRASLNLNLKNRSQLSISAGVGSSIVKNRMRYESKEGNVENNISEHSVSPSLRIGYMINPAERLTITGSLRGHMMRLRANYSGTMLTEQRMAEDNCEFTIDGRYSFLQGWSTRLQLNLPVSALKVNDGSRTTDFTPEYMFQIDGMIGERQSLSVTSRAITHTKVLSSYNSLNRPDSPIEGTAGNMNLKQPKIFNNDIWYMWMPSNRIQLSFSGEWEFRKDAMVIDYFYKDGIIYNRLDNGGNFNKVSGSVNVTVRMFSGILSLRPGVDITHFHHSGIYPFNFQAYYASVMCNVKLSDHVALNCYYSTPSKTNIISGGGYSKIHHHLFKIGGSFSGKNVSASLSVMPFYTSTHDTMFKDGPCLSERIEEWRVVGSRRVDLNLKYTINFGKKVNRQFLFVEEEMTTSVR